MIDIIVNTDDLLDFWFSERVAKLWFNSTPEFDQELRDKFMETYRTATLGHLDDWQETAKGALALVIIFDQLPLNMFRSKPESFATEENARHIAGMAVNKGFDQALTDRQKAFLYMPFMHSEDLGDQDRSVALYEKANLKDNLRFALHHRDIIRRFGRFPHRNFILGRESTKEELEYLASKEAFHG